MNVLDRCCSVDGPEGDIDGDAKAEVAFNDRHPRLDDERAAADELGLAHRLQELLQSPEQVLALVSVKGFRSLVMSLRSGKGRRVNRKWFEREEHCFDDDDERRGREARTRDEVLPKSQKFESRVYLVNPVAGFVIS